MEAVALPGSAKVAPGVSGVEFGNALLGGDGGEIEERVFVVKFADDFGVLDGAGGVDGDEEILGGGGTLEVVHPVDRGVAGALDAVVPGGPAAPVFGHERFVRVEDGFVRLVMEGGEEFLFERGR